MELNLTRRRFLRLGGVTLAALGGGALGLAPRFAGATAGRAADPLLVVVFLRGGADGLHIVPPVGDAAYARARGALALPRALPFTEGFGLHPALAALSPLVARGELAAVHAVGSDDRSRSHFEAQDRMELADPERRSEGAGWLARALVADRSNPFSRLALASALPLALAGSGAFAIADPGRFGLDGASETLRQGLEARYAHAADDPVAEAGRQAFGALADYERLVPRSGAGAREVAAARRGRGRRADPPLPERVRQLVALVDAGLPLRAVALEAHGWDTHQRQGLEQGAMVRPLTELATALATLSEGLSGRRAWRAVVMTEFGRTVRPNGSGGSDHGHASAMLLAGPGVRPGVHGPWPGLADDRLHEGRDLTVATDYRDVLHEVLAATFGPLPSQAFPGLSPKPLGLFV